MVVVLLQRIPWNISPGLFVLGMAQGSSPETVCLEFSSMSFLNGKEVYISLGLARFRMKYTNMMSLKPRTNSAGISVCM